MANKDSQLLFKVSSIVKDKKARHIVQDKENYKVSIVLGIYEVYLSYKNTSPETVKTELRKLCYLWTFAKLRNIPLEQRLSQGNPLSTADIRAFSFWLSELTFVRNGTRKHLDVKTYNAILTSCSNMMVWFASQYLKIEGDVSNRYLTLAQIESKIQSDFKHQKKKDKKSLQAPDLTEEEIQKIENYLKPENNNAPSDIALRNYIMWRLVIEFGLRISEILALRLEDCPNRKQNYIKIVRIEERGQEYYDPRTPYEPRPKTLSRDLGFIFSDSPLKKFLNEYITKHRFKTVEKFGQKKRVPIIINPNFLILNHKTRSGSPLSRAAAQDIAKDIKKNTGVDFNWHLGRHAFFNRAYAAIANSKDYGARRMDLVYWGGWADQNSLEIYTNRAKKQQAQKALTFWQNDNSWEALE
jgi:integrase